MRRGGIFARLARKLGAAVDESRRGVKLVWAVEAPPPFCSPPRRSPFSPLPLLFKVLPPPFEVNMVNVRDVTADAFINAYAQHLKRSG